MPEPRTIALAPLGMSPEEIAGRSFAVVRRGLDPDAVRRFLEEVAGVVRQARAREMELQSRLVDAEQRAASPVLDEAVLSAALGTETARVLKVAHEAAQEVVQKAEHRAAALLDEAATVHATRAAEAEAEAEAVLEEARRAAEDIVERTKAECRSTLEHARQARRRVLDDLAHRRRDLSGQIEQLRAAKDTLTGIFGQAAAAVAELQDRLDGADDEADEAASDLAQHLHDEAAVTTRLDAASLGLVAAAGEPSTLPAADHGLDEAAEASEFEDELARLQPVHDPARPAAGDGDGFADADDLVDAEPYANSAVAPFDGDAVVEHDTELFDGDAVEAAATLAAPFDDDDDLTSAAEPAEPEVADGEPEPEGAAGAEASQAAARADAVAGGAGAASRYDAATGGAADPGLATVESQVAAAEAEGGAGEPRAIEDTGADAVEPPAGAEPSTGSAAPASTGPGRSGSAVDALFARIRASRAEEVAKAREVLAEPDVDLGAAAEADAETEARERPGWLSGEPAGAGASAVEPAVAPEGAPGVEPEVRGSRAEGPEGGGDEAEGLDEPEGAGVAARRDEVLAPVRAEVARALKRVLRSQQNELLDAARTLKLSEADALLAGDETFVHIAEAVESPLEAAWRSGRAEVGDPAASTVDAGAVGELATGLAVEVVGAIETRIRDGISTLRASGETTEDGLGELVGVAYRDWKGGRIDAVADEVALRAFAAGSVAGAAAIGAKLRWLLQQDQPCADCDDNALSSPLSAGEAFPTGQTHPPLHSGCRCVLVAVPG